MLDAVADFLKSVNIPASRVINTPNLIFLCGGITKKNGLYESARDYFHRYLRANNPSIAKRVRLAENVNKSLNPGSFSDLLDLENYLADVSDLLIIFVESPGSIAELGAFAASAPLNPKTLAVLNSHYNLERTFIADGPVKRIKDRQAYLYHYEWDPDDLNSAATVGEFKDMSEDLIKLLEERQHSASREQILNVETHGHKMLLVADLIGVIGITFEAELLECLTLCGCQVTKQDFQRYVTLLEYLHIIVKKHNSRYTYYLSRGVISYIDYAGVRDKERAKVPIRQVLLP
jgi:hypothetical protein